MLKFLSGFFTALVVVVIAVVCVVFCVPVSAFTGMVPGLPPEVQNMDIINQPIIQAGQAIGSAFSNLPTKSVLDIETALGINIFSTIKEKLGIPKDNTSFDSLRTCTIGNLSNGVKELKVNDVLMVAKVTLDSNMQDMIGPMLNKSINEIASNTTAVLGEITNNIKIKNLKAINPDILPNIPLFADNRNEEKLIPIFKNISALTIGDFIDVTKPGTDPLLVKLAGCTLLENPNYVPTPENAKDPKFVINFIMNMKIGDIIHTNTASPLLEKIKGYTINDLKDNTLFNQLTIGEIAGITPEKPSKSAILNSLKDVTIADLTGPNAHQILSNAFNTVKLGDVITITEASPKFLKALKNEPIANISSKFDTFTLDDVMNIDRVNDKNNLLLKLTVDVEENGIIKKVPLIDRPIKTIGTDINGALDNAKLSDVMVVPETSLLYKMGLADKPIKDMSSSIDKAVENLKLTDVMTVQKGTFLDHLVNKCPNTSIKTIDKDIQTVMNNAKLIELKSWGMLPNTVDLDKQVGGTVTEGGTTRPKTLGDCTIEDLINLINKIPNVPAA